MVARSLMVQIEYSIVDLMIYSHPERDPYAIYREVQEKTRLLYPDNDLRFLNQFLHIFSGSYAAGYYGYKYADVLSADVFEEFKQSGVVCKEVGRRFLNEILAKGSSDDLINLFVNFKGRKPNEEALIKSYQLN